MLRPLLCATYKGLPATRQSLINLLPLPATVVPNRTYFKIWRYRFMRRGGNSGQFFDEIKYDPQWDYRHNRTRYSPGQRYEMTWEDAQPLSAKDVTDRYYRLYNGLWVHRQPGQNKKWRRDQEVNKQLEKHVFATEEDQDILDRMVTRKYRERRHYVDNPFEPYEDKQSLPEYAGYTPKKFYP